jgi:enterochelin esterase-like enzyme
VAPGRLLHETFYSPALHAKRKYLVYEPPGYAAAAARGQRFPVLYLLHGSPGQPQQFMNVAGAGVVMDELVDAHKVKPFLLVMPSGEDGHFRNKHEWANTPYGRWENLVLETAHNVDQRFATKHGRRFRAIGGNSEGGYGAVNIGLRHPKEFSIIESWSGYLWQARQGPFKHATDAEIHANDPEGYIPTLRAQLKRYPTHAFLYKATREPQLVKDHALAVALSLRAAGGHVTFSIFKGGHDWRVWRDQTPRMLVYANRWFGARR